MRVVFLLCWITCFASEAIYLEESQILVEKSQGVADSKARTFFLGEIERGLTLHRKIPGFGEGYLRSLVELAELALKILQAAESLPGEKYLPHFPEKGSIRFVFAGVPSIG